MKPVLTAAAISLLITSSLHANPLNPWDQYQSLATTINNKVETASLEQLSQYSSKLTKLSTKLLPVFVAKQPACKEYINAALAATDEMLNSSLEAIERDYHADGKLPPMKRAVCYHAKDLLVHPATMAVIAKTQKDSPKTREMISHELEEVLAHFGEVKT